MQSIEISATRCIAMCTGDPRVALGVCHVPPCVTPESMCDHHQAIAIAGLPSHSSRASHRLAPTTAMYRHHWLAIAFVMGNGHDDSPGCQTDLLFCRNDYQRKGDDRSFAEQIVALRPLSIESRLWGLYSTNGGDRVPALQILGGSRFWLLRLPLLPPFRRSVFHPAARSPGRSRRRSGSAPRWCARTAARRPRRPGRPCKTVDMFIRHGSAVERLFLLGSPSLSLSPGSSIRIGKWLSFLQVLLEVLPSALAAHGIRRTHLRSASEVSFGGRFLSGEPQRKRRPRSCRSSSSASGSKAL